MEDSKNIAELKSEILTLHKASIQAHLDKNVSFFVQDLSSNYTTVSRGEIHQPAIEDIRELFTNYLYNTTFSEYRDLQEPIIGFSKDGSLAWSIVQVKVAGKRAIEGVETDMDFTCAWLMLYERQDDKWIQLVNVSTFKP